MCVEENTQWSIGSFLYLYFLFKNIDTHYQFVHLHFLLDIVPGRKCNIDFTASDDLFSAYCPLKGTIIINY